MRRWLAGAGLILLTAGGAIGVGMLQPEPPHFPLHTVSADEMAAIGISIQAIPPSPPWEEPLDRLADLLPAPWVTPKVRKAPQVAPPRLGMTLIDETALAMVTVPRWTIYHRKSWVRSGRDPAVPGARFVVIADPAGHAEPLRLVLPRSLAQGQAPACERTATVPGPPASGLSAAEAEALAARYEQPGMAIVVCAVPRLIGMGNGSTSARWAWEVVMASGSRPLPGRPLPSMAPPTRICFTPTTSAVYYDYVSGAAVPSDGVEICEPRS